MGANDHTMSLSQDNCAQDINVNLKVSSNEFAYDNVKTSESMVLVRETKDDRQSHRLHIFVEPSQCDRNPPQGSEHVKPLCHTDIGTVLFRFYRIEIAVTDYASVSFCQ